MNDYEQQALRTVSAGFSPEKADLQELCDAYFGVISRGADLDHAKKNIFYSRGEDREHDGAGKSRFNQPEFADLIHGVIGIATEAAELLQRLWIILSQSEMDEDDFVNLLEELGDMEWYMALVRDFLKVDQNHVQQLNLNKLRMRYPDVFDAWLAENRDLEAEKTALRGE